MSLFGRSGAWGLFLLLSLAAGLPSDVAAQRPKSLPEIEPMPGMETTWVARTIRHNGVPMSIRRFTRQGPAEEVVRFYRRRWKGRGVTVEDRTGDGFRVVGHGNGAYYFSVQVRDTGRHAEGRLVVSAAGVRPSAETRFPLPPGVRPLSVMESFDGPRIAETVIAEDRRRSRTTLVEWYRHRLSRLGWAVAWRGGGEGERGAILDLQRGSELVRLTFVPSGVGRGTRFIVNWIREQ